MSAHVYHPETERALAEAERTKITILKVRAQFAPAEAAREMLKMADQLERFPTFNKQKLET
jgi:hypothetical protein